MRRLVTAAAIALGCGSPWRIAAAEVIGPLLPAGSFEIGIQDRDTHRTEVNDSGAKQTLDQHDLAVVLRWAPTEFATFSAEGMRGQDEWLSGYSGVEAFYLLGAGAQATLWRRDRVLVSGGMQYTETFHRLAPDGSNGEHDLVTMSLAWQAIAQVDVHALGQPVVLWAGPTYSLHDMIFVDRVDRFGRNLPDETLTADQTWGALLGVGVLAGGRVNVTAHVLWVGKPQPRFGVAYRF